MPKYVLGHDLKGEGSATRVDVGIIGSDASPVH